MNLIFIPFLINFLFGGEIKSTTDIYPFDPGAHLLNSVVDTPTSISRSQKGMRFHLNLSCWKQNLRKSSAGIKSQRIVEASFKFSGQSTPLIIQFPGVAAYQGFATQSEITNPGLPVQLDPPIAPDPTICPWVPPIFKNLMTSNCVTLWDKYNFDLKRFYLTYNTPKVKQPQSLGVELGWSGRTVIISAPTVQANYSITEDGKLNIENQESSTLTGFSFNVGSYAIRRFSTEGNNVYINASFPSLEKGFCGTYVSPLMIFDSEQRPRFNNTSAFNLYKEQTRPVYWPEKNSPGYFLIHDPLNKNFVTDGMQMFGDTDEFENGFEKIKSFDLDKNNRINAKDKIFSELKLWNDKNGDGISQKTEIYPLSHLNITEIDLNYKNVKEHFGIQAYAKQKSTFIFTKNGKFQTGEIADIWFNSPNGMSLSSSMQGQ